VRILHLATFLQGGAGRVVVDLADSQRRAGHDVTVVTSATGPAGYGNYPEYLDRLAGSGITTCLVDSTFERDHARNVSVLAILDRLFGSGQEPQVIHTHAAIPSLIALLFAGARRRSALTVIQTMHGWGQSKTADQAATDVAILNLVDRVVVPSSHSASLLAALGVAERRIVTIAYGVRNELPPCEEADRGTLEMMKRQRLAGRLVLACVGTIGARKNQTLLIDAIARVTSENVACVFVGDGDDRLLRRAVTAAGCGSRIRLHGYSRAARRLAAEADLLVLPSRREGQPLAVLDAFCDGTLVAVSDIPELVELVADDGTGFVFADNDAESLARAIVQVAALPEAGRRRVCDAARSRYAADFTLDRMVDRYEALYKAMVRGNGSGPERTMTNEEPTFALS